MFKTELQDVFLKTFWRRLGRRLEDVLRRRFEDVLKKPWRRLWKRSCKQVLKTSWRRLGRWKIITLKTSSRRLGKQEMFAGIYLLLQKYIFNRNVPFKKIYLYENFTKLFFFFFFFFFCIIWTQIICSK